MNPILAVPRPAVAGPRAAVLVVAAGFPAVTHAVANLLVVL